MMGSSARSMEKPKAATRVGLGSAFHAPCRAETRQRGQSAVGYGRALICITAKSGNLGHELAPAERVLHVA
jgi:hypothetical protein